jgi:hypothetical protein
MIERRQKPRNKVRIEATLVLDDGLLRLPAEVRNASPFGAKLALADVLALPERFYVLFNHRIELCRLVWQTDTELGLVYED